MKEYFEERKAYDVSCDPHGPRLVCARQEGVGGVHEQPRAGPSRPPLPAPPLDPGHTLPPAQAQAVQLRVVQPQRLALTKAVSWNHISFLNADSDTGFAITLVGSIFTFLFYCYLIFQVAKII